LSFFILFMKFYSDQYKAQRAAKLSSAESTPAADSGALAGDVVVKPPNEHAEKSGRKRHSDVGLSEVPLSAPPIGNGSPRALRSRAKKTPQ